MTLAAGETRFWTDIDLDYEGDAALSYRVEILRDGTKVAETECDPLGAIKVKLAWVETNLGDHHTRSGRGRMECSITLDAAGPAVVRAKLRFTRKPKQVELKKADLVVKQ
jgi:hypothetical protein